MRKFNIKPFVRYVVNIQKGKVKFYAGSSTVAQEVAEYANAPYRCRSVFGWENAPYIRLICDDGGGRSFTQIANRIAGDKELLRLLLNEVADRIAGEEPVQ